MPETNDARRLYGDLAHLWPLMSPPEDYVEEARYWRRELCAHLGPGRRRVLDLGTGGGHYLHHLTGDFDAVAVDRSDAMLDHARRLNPGVAHHVGDMRSVRLGERFDAVLAHDAIDYMTSEADLLAAFETARAHLLPGGLFLTAPDHYAETFDAPFVFHETQRADGRELTYVEYATDPDPTDTQVETVYVFFFAEDGELGVEVDRDVMGLFPLATWERLLGEAGFDAERVDYPVSEDGRPLYLWVARLR